MRRNEIRKKIESHADRVIAGSKEALANARPQVLKSVFDQDEREAQFETQLAKEVLASEKLRTAILAGIAFLAFPTLAMLMLFSESALRTFVKNRPAEYLTYGVVIGSFFFLYELGMWLWLRRAIAKNQSLSALSRYANASVEITIVTAVLFLNSITQNAAYALIIGPFYMYYFFIALSVLRLDIRLSIFTGALAAAEYYGLYYFYAADLFDMSLNATLVSPVIHGEKAILLLAFGLLMGVVAYTVRHFVFHSFQVVEDKNTVVNIFGQHVSPAVVEKLLNQNENHASETRHVCMMFLDIRNFTAYSEKRTPDEVFEYLNFLFDFMIDIVNENGGIINKFLGDGFMAVFGAPNSNGNDSANAVRAGLEILARVRSEIALGSIPDTNIGIGLHAGSALTGSIGSSKRKEYTIIGDVVNLASRIEQLNKTYNSNLLISESVNEAVGGHDASLRGEFMGEVQVKGREVPVRIYRIA